ncbi:MAG: hypothetical protein OEW79_14695, partial [Betaproteobacteria bacterium]|nr:hypothetical protein [Betaproteobacteria bacterium]
MQVIVRNSIFRLFALSLLTGLAGSAWAEPVTVERDSSLFAEPRAGAGVTGNLAKGTTGEA